MSPPLEMTGYVDVDLIGQARELSVLLHGYKIPSKGKATAGLLPSAIIFPP